jgi:hypothetical protein
LGEATYVGNERMIWKIPIKDKKRDSTWSHMKMNTSTRDPVAKPASLKMVE